LPAEAFRRRWNRVPFWLFVEFSDGVSGEIDLSTRLFGPMFEPLRDPAFFAAVTLDAFGVPTWPNGADLAPEPLYGLASGLPPALRGARWVLNASRRVERRSSR
jgi:hypothetical protein